MPFRELLADTVRTLRAHKLRTFLTMFGIAWGIISITLMVAAGEGFRAGQQRAAETFGKDIMIVFAGRTSLQAGGGRRGLGADAPAARRGALAGSAARNQRSGSRNALGETISVGDFPYVIVGVMREKEQ